MVHKVYDRSASKDEFSSLAYSEGLNFSNRESVISRAFLFVVKRIVGVRCGLDRHPCSLINNLFSRFVPYFHCVDAS